MPDETNTHSTEERTDEERVDIKRDDINDPTKNEEVSDLSEDGPQELEEDKTADPEYEKF